MNSVFLESRPWPRRRWCGMVTLVVTAQLGLIFWLGDTSPVTPRGAGPSPRLDLIGNSRTELFALEDPSLFALPHSRGFSGFAWLAAPNPPALLTNWSESPGWLPPATPGFSSLLTRRLEANESNEPHDFGRPEPESSAGTFLPQAEATQQSVLRLEGALAARRLLTPLVLPLQTNMDPLTNSEVQVVVDAGGRVVSVPVLLSKSGNLEADNSALRQALSARFEPVGAAGPPTTNAGDSPKKLTWGRMIFEWRTVLVPATNVPVSESDARN